MQLAHLSLANFRNFTRLESDFPAGATLLVGANAQGKTSLLEAIHYLAGAASPHASSDRQLINFLALNESRPFARIAGEVRRRDRLHRVEIRLILENQTAEGEGRVKKEVLINGLKRRVRELGSTFNAVLFLPQDLRVIEGSPGERRRLLDAALAQADPTYAEAASSYAKVLAQRNALLRQLQDRGGAPDTLFFWDEQLADLGSTLIHARALALHELEQLAAPIHHALTRGAEQLRLAYQPAYNPLQDPNGQMGLPLQEAVDWTSLRRETLRSGILAALERTRQHEIARGATLIGPHRDDLRFLANSLDLRQYGSRGQARTALLAFKLAQAEWLRARSGEWPVLLLDEVLAELDAERRDDLLARVLQAQQVVLTAADLNMFSRTFREQASVWRIHGGTVEPMDG